MLSTHNWSYSLSVPLRSNRLGQWTFATNGPQMLHSKHYTKTSSRAICLDQLLIVIRSSLIVCDHLQSKTRLIVIIAKLWIIYTAWPHNSVLSILSLPQQSTAYKHSTGRESEKMRSGESEQHQPPLTDNRRTSCCPLLDCSQYL